MGQIDVAAGTRRVFALLIAGDQVGSPGTPTPGALAALAIIDRDLRARFNAGAAIEQLGGAPTRLRVLSAFARLQAVVRRDDLLVVMFAGHGVEADPRAAQPAQAWSLTANETFTDFDLATALLGCPAGVDIVVICDCCYGEGFFVPGDGAQDLQQQRRDARGAVWQSVAEASPMVCISAASDIGMVSLAKLAELAIETVRAAAAGESYAELAHAFDEHKLTGREFHVDARPAERLGDAVLATTACGVAFVDDRRARGRRSA
jgi:hypothetical protein